MTQIDSTLRRIGIIALTLVIVTSGVLPFVTMSPVQPAEAAETTANATYYDDFGDGDYNGWNSIDDSQVSIVNDGYVNNRSLYLDDGGDGPKTHWESGPTFDMGESFEITGTYKVGSTGNGAKLSIQDPSGNSDSEVSVFFNNGDNTAVLSTHPFQSDPDDSISYDDFDKWMRFRMVSDGGVTRIKLWEAGTEEPDKWQLEGEFDSFEGKFTVQSGVVDNGRELWLGSIDAGGNAITGQVVDQNGDPVENATVEAVGVDYDSLNNTIENKEEEAKRLLEDAQDPLPDAWNPDKQLTGSGSVFAESETKVVAVHTTNDWQLGGSQLPGTSYRVNADPTLGDPMLVAPNDEQLILSMWDPTKSGGLVLDREDSADSDLPGRTTSGTIVIEQISPSGEVVDTIKRDTQQYATLKPSFSIDTKTHEAIAVDLPNNHFYRVYPEGEKQSAYVFARGNPKQIGYALSQDLRNEAEQLTQRAEKLRSLIEDGTFRRVTTTTNESGYYEIRTLHGIKTASVQAYKADGTILTQTTGPSIQTLRTAHERGYNGSVYISGAPKRVDVPSANNTITVYESPTPPFGDMGDYQDILDYLKNALKDESMAVLESMFNDQLENLDLADLEQRHAEVEQIIQSNEQLRERVNELVDSDLSDGDKSREELIAELEAMDRAISDLEEQLEAQPPDTGIEEGQLHGTFPFAGQLNSDAVSVVLHYQNGTSQVVPEDYWRVESASVLGGDQVVVDGYPIPSGTAVADIEVTGVSEDGRLGSSRGSVINPAFDQDVPAIEAIDISTLRPGVNERVGLSVRSDDPAFRIVEDVTVYGPDGAQLNTTTNSVGRTTFTPSDTGVHSIRVTYSNQGGTNFVETFRIEAKEQPTSDPATVRIIEGLGGPTAIAGDQLESASVSVDGKKAEIIAQAPGGEEPANLDVRANSLTVDTIDVNVVSGSSEEAVSQHVSVRLFTDFGTEETLVYRGSPSEPITKSGSTKFGAWETRESEGGDTHRVVATYTDSNGEVTIDTSRNPGWIERIIYQISVSSPIEIPLLSMTPIDLTMTHTLSITSPVVADTASTVQTPAAPAAAAVGVGA